MEAVKYLHKFYTAKNQFKNSNNEYPRGWLLFDGLDYKIWIGTAIIIMFLMFHFIYVFLL